MPLLLLIAALAVLAVIQAGVTAGGPCPEERAGGKCGVPLARFVPAPARQAARTALDHAADAVRPAAVHAAKRAGMKVPDHVERKAHRTYGAGPIVRGFAAGPEYWSGPAAPDAWETSGLNYRVADAGLSSAGAWLSARDWTHEDMRLGRAGRLTVAWHDPADPSLPLNTLEAGARLTAAALGADPRAARRSVAVHYAIPAIRRRAGDLDFDITPRAGFSAGPDGSAAGAGALVRLGEFVSGPRVHGAPRWYFFAGAEAQAVSLDPRGKGMSELLRYEDRTIVGDVQAGVAMSVGRYDLALAYVRSESAYTTPYYGIVDHEEFATISVTLRR